MPFSAFSRPNALCRYAFKNFKNNKFLGTRSRNADGTWGGYNFLSYGDVERLGSAFGSALRDLGLNAVRAPCTLLSPYSLYFLNFNGLHPQFTKSISPLLPTFLTHSLLDIFLLCSKTLSVSTLSTEANGLSRCLLVCSNPCLLFPSTILLVRPA